MSKLVVAKNKPPMPKGPGKMTDHPSAAHETFAKACGTEAHGMPAKHTTKPMVGSKRAIHHSKY